MHKGGCRFLRRSFLGLWVATILASVTRAQVIFIDPCGITIPPFTTGQLTVWVCVENQILEGITSAQFRIDGLPSGWQVEVTPAGTAVSTGELFGAGVSVGFPTCENGVPVLPNARYLALYSVRVFATDDTSDILLAVATRSPPADPGFDCPLVTLCDEPALTKVCVGNHGAIVNPVFRSCGLPVEAMTWGKIKAVYR